MREGHSGLVPLYLSLIAMQWGLFLWIWRGGLRSDGNDAKRSHRRRVDKCERCAGRLRPSRSVWWAVWTLVDAAWNRWFGAGHAASIQSYLPQRAQETPALDRRIR